MDDFRRLAVRVERFKRGASESFLPGLGAFVASLEKLLASLRDKVSRR